MMTYEEAIAAACSVYQNRQVEMSSFNCPPVEDVIAEIFAMIGYLPGCIISPVEAEDDGQPSEAQEWRDYDPAC